jgi:hypothetical protein
MMAPFDSSLNLFFFWTNGHQRTYFIETRAHAGMLYALFLLRKN